MNIQQHFWMQYGRIGLYKCAACASLSSLAIKGPCYLSQREQYKILMRLTPPVSKQKQGVKNEV